MSENPDENEDWWKDCICTEEQALADLLRVEAILAGRFNVSTEAIRETLFAMDQRNELIEDEVVSDWHQAYAWWLGYKNRDEE